MSKLSLIPEENKCVKSKENINNTAGYLCGLNKKKILHPLLSTATMSVTSHNINRNGGGDRNISKRILSAKDHRMKQLQNQLADAHYHLNELTNENRLLRNMQKRMDSALQRYVGINGDIPKIFNSHNEELRSWQTRFKQSKLQMKETEQRLKEKDVEFQKLNDEHRHLLTLSKDTKLCEREKLQYQVNDLTDKLIKKTETVGTLQKKLNIEAKSYKHQINIEVQKHKETQNQLNNALSECERLNSIIEKKDKIMASTFLKKSPKINLSSSERNICKESKKNVSSFDLNMLIDGKSVMDNQISEKSSSKADHHSDSTFTVTDKKKSSENIFKRKKEYFKNDIESSSDSNTLIKDFELSKVDETDKEDDVPSNGNVKDRVDGLKKQMSKKLNQTKVSSIPTRSKRIPKTKVSVKSSKFSNSCSDSSPEEVINSPFEFSENVLSKQNTNMYIPLLNLDTEVIENDAEFINSIKAGKSFNFEILDENCQELEEKAAQERFMVEDILEKISDGVLTNCSEPSFNGSESSSVSKNNSANEVSVAGIKKSYKPLEVNNNGVNSRKVSSDLDEEKKQKLLATLKAIDRGDDDGLCFEGVPKVKSRGKFTKN